MAPKTALPRRSFLAAAGSLSAAALLASPARLLAAAGVQPPREVAMRTRDGVTLKADLYLPAGVAGPVPVLLVRTPYLKTNLLSIPEHVLTIADMLTRGVAVVIQDVRGAGVSDGEFVPLGHEKADSSDTLAWLQTQEWCNGTIRAGGASYLGFTTLASAVAGDPALDACLYVNTCADAYRGWYYSQGGVLSVENTDRYAWFVTGANRMHRGDEAGGKALMARGTKIAARLHDGGKATAQALGSEAAWFGEILGHPLRDEYWKRLSYSEDFAKVRARGLHVGGWFDFFAYYTVGDYRALSRQAATAEARENQYLIMGPWTHMSTTGLYEGHDFGPQASALAMGLETMVAGFLADPQGAQLPKASWFVMGANEWRHAETFPPPGTQIATFAIDPARDAPAGLVRKDKAHRRSSRLIPVDLESPVPTLGGRLLSTGDAWTSAGPTDQRPVEARDDVASFTAAPFDRRTEIAGSLHAQVYVSTTMADADVAVTVTDVSPQGTSRLLCEGIARLSLRDGSDRVAPVESGKIYRLVIELGVTANAFLPGHALRINVSGSNFPNFALNPGAIGPGDITIHAGPGMVSKIMVPVSG